MLGEPRGVERHQFDGAPDAAGNEHRAPVPAEIARLFAHPAAPATSRGERPTADGALLLALSNIGEGGGEAHLEGVLAGMQQLL